MQAIILAGGKGTRMGNLTKDIPKPMIEVCEMPVLLHQIGLCKRYGIVKFIIIVNHFYQNIQSYFGTGSQWGVQIEYYIEDSPLGTVGGIKAIENQLTETFIVIYGDVIVNMNLEKLIQFHQHKKSAATLVLHPNDHPFDSDLVEMNSDDQITAFHAKPHAENVYYRNLVNAGLYVFEPSVLPFLDAGVKADFGKDIFPELYAKINMYGYNTTEYLKDMGTPARLEQVTSDLLSGKVERSNLEHQRACIFIDRDGVINHEVGLISSAEQFEIFDFVPDAIRKINKSEFIAIVVTNQSVIARNLTDENGLRKIHNKMEWILGQQHTKIDDLYYCPHHPDGGYEGEKKAYKMDCDCRKPKSGMLIQASKKYHINLSKSWIIGDTERDIQAGKNVACTTVGVRTGMGCKTTDIHPDYMFSNLKEAVDFIIDTPYQPVYKKVMERFSANDNKKPFVLTIGGNTCSGKSTLSTYLQKEFEAQHWRVLRVNLDDWLLPIAARLVSKDVFERYQILQLVKDIFALLAGHEVLVQEHQHAIISEPKSKSYTIKGYDIILIEGVVALSMPQLRGISDCKIYKKIDRACLQVKMKNFYLWKGYDSKEIDAIFEKRITDEYELIEYDEQFAHIIA